MPEKPSLVFIPGSWHKPSCYDKIIKPLQSKHDLKCIPVTLPSTSDNPNATFKDDIDAARAAITSETSQGRNVIVIAHSYGGMVGNSAVKGFTRHHSHSTSGPGSTGSVERDKASDSASAFDAASDSGYVVALVLIASGFTLTGLAFMDPFFGIPPPSWRVDRETGYAVLVADPREFFYHDLPPDEAEYRASELMTQSLKALFEGGEHAYAGWQDVPSWYVGTVEDRGLPVVMQRITVGMARAQGAVVYHTELKSGHLPFLSMPEEVVAVILDAVRVTMVNTGLDGRGIRVVESQLEERKGCEVPRVKLLRPGTWWRFGVPYFVGRVMGWGITGIIGLRRMWRGG